MLTAKLPKRHVPELVKLQLREARRAGHKSALIVQRGADGDYYWTQYHTSNYNVIADGSEGYKRPGECTAAAQRQIELMKLDPPVLRGKDPLPIKKGG